jgi:hypothetical protein
MMTVTMIIMLQCTCIDIINSTSGCSPQNIEGGKLTDSLSSILSC